MGLQIGIVRSIEISVTSCYNLFLMRTEADEALKSPTRPYPTFLNPDLGSSRSNGHVAGETLSLHSYKPNIYIPSSSLLGYRGPDKVFGYYAPGLPKTVNEEPIPAASDLEWRPLRVVLEEKIALAKDETPFTNNGHIKRPVESLGRLSVTAAALS